MGKRSLLLSTPCRPEPVSQPTPPRGIIAEQAASADISAHLFEGPVAGLVHDGAFGGAATGGRGGEAGSERVSGKGTGIETGPNRESLDDLCDLVIADFTIADFPAPPAQGAKQRSGADARLLEPGLERTNGAGVGMRAGRDADRVPFPFLVGLRLRDGDNQTAFGKLHV